MDGDPKNHPTLVFLDGDKFGVRGLVCFAKPLFYGGDVSRLLWDVNHRPSRVEKNIVGVIPAQAGIPLLLTVPSVLGDSRLRGNDGKGVCLAPTNRYRLRPCCAVGGGAFRARMSVFKCQRLFCQT